MENITRAAARRLLKDECTLAVSGRCGERRWERFCVLKALGRMGRKDKVELRQTKRHWQKWTSGWGQTWARTKTLFNLIVAPHVCTSCVLHVAQSISDRDAKHCRNSSLNFTAHKKMCASTIVSPLTLSTKTKCSDIFHSARLQDFAQHLSQRLTASQSAHRVVVECHVKQDPASQPSLLNKLTATVERKWELVVVLNGINGLSGVPAPGIAGGNFLHVLKTFLCPWFGPGVHWTTPAFSFS